MSTEVRIPKLGMGMTEGKLVEWLVADGATVAEGDNLYVLENDKSSQDVESPASGVVTIIAKGDETYDVGEVIGRID